MYTRCIYRVAGGAGDCLEPKENLKEKAYSIIKNKIIRCEYRPGQFLNEQELREAVGASRTPIREALNKLEQEGLLEILPKRGVLVRDITLQEVNAIFEIRCMVEPYVIETYGHLVSLADIQAMHQKIHASSFDTENLNEYDVDHDLHEMLIKACDNPYILEMMAKIFGQNHRLRILSGQRLEYRLRDTALEHEQILHLLASGKRKEAADAMREHLKHSREAAIAMMTGSKGWKQIV